jgi:hypothetical protein
MNERVTAPQGTCNTFGDEGITHHSRNAGRHFCFGARPRERADAMSSRDKLRDQRVGHVSGAAGHEDAGHGQKLNPRSAVGISG